MWRLPFCFLTCDELTWKCSGRASTAAAMEGAVIPGM